MIRLKIYSKVPQNVFTIPRGLVVTVFGLLICDSRTVGTTIRMLFLIISIDNSIDLQTLSCCSIYIRNGRALEFEVKNSFGICNVVIFFFFSALPSIKLVCFRPSLVGINRVLIIWTWPFSVIRLQNIFNR